MRHSNVRRAAVATIIGTALFVAPLLASAQTSTASVTDLQSQIKALLTQLSSLQQQLVQLRAGTEASSSVWMMGSTTPPIWNPGMASSTLPIPPHGVCPMPVRNLSIGSRGDDVSQLQQFLAQDPSIFPQGLMTGFFGSSTAAAVMRFQKENNIASTVTGLVGPLTRAFLDNHCGGNGGGDSGRGLGMMGSTTTWMTGTTTHPWMPATTTRPWMSGTTTMQFGEQGMIVPPPHWLTGSTTGPLIPPPPSTVHLQDGPENQGGGSGSSSGGWHGSVPPWQSNQ